MSESDIKIEKYGATTFALNVAEETVEILRIDQPRCIIPMMDLLTWSIGAKGGHYEKACDLYVAAMGEASDVEAQ